MRIYSVSKTLAAVGCLVLLTSCGDDPKTKAIPANKVPSAVVQAPGPAAAATQKCEGGGTPQVITGECSGVWSVKKTDGVANCEFEWKPRVTCPTGTTAVGLQSACYGVTIRPGNSNTKTSEDCLAAHGKHPISPAFKLECCP